MLRKSLQHLYSPATTQAALTSIGLLETVSGALSHSFCWISPMGFLWFIIDIFSTVPFFQVPGMSEPCDLCAPILRGKFLLFVGLN